MNNTTIDGVSLATLEAYIASATGYDDARLRGELRDLLDAHKVNNRQMGIMQFVESHPVVPAAERCTSCDDSGDLTDLTGEWRGYCTCPAGEALKNKPAVTPEVSALQSTIARLEARITQLESEKKFAAATYQAARERIAELESGRGEPVAWMYLERADDGYEYRPLLSQAKWSVLPDGFYNETPLFTAPPAPVAVVLPQKSVLQDLAYKRYGYRTNQLCMLNGSELEWVWQACLDATAALNKSP